MLWSVLPLLRWTPGAQPLAATRRNHNHVVYREQLRHHACWDMYPAGYGEYLGVDMELPAGSPGPASTMLLVPALEKPTPDDLRRLENAILWRVASAPHVVLAFPLWLAAAGTAGAARMWNGLYTWRDSVLDEDIFAASGVPLKFHANSGKRLRLVVKGQPWNPHDMCVGCPKELDRALKASTCYPLSYGCLGAASRHKNLPASIEELRALPLVLPPPEAYVRISEMFPYVPFTRRRQVRIVSPLEKGDPGATEGAGSMREFRNIAPGRKAVLTRRIRTFLCPGCALAAAGIYRHADGTTCTLSYARKPVTGTDFVATCYGPFTNADLVAAMDRQPDAKKSIQPWMAHVLAMARARQPFDDNRKNRRAPLLAVMPVAVSGDQAGRFVVVAKDVRRHKYNQVIPYESACAQAGVPVARTEADLDAPAIAGKHPLAGYIYRMLREPRHAMLRIALNRMIETLQAPTRAAFQYYGVLEGVDIHPADDRYPFGRISVLFASASAGAEYPRTLLHPTDHIECAPPASLCTANGGAPKHICWSAVIPSASRPRSYDDDDGRTALTPEKLAVNLAYAKYILHGTGERGLKSYAEFERDYASTGTVGS